MGVGLSEGQPARVSGERDACPGVVRLHAAADGHLARVRLPGGRLGPRALDAIVDAAVLGNGVVELTSRAGLQVRGLREHSAGALAGVLSAGGLLPSATHDRVRNILAAPLAGRSPAALAAVDPLVDELDRALCADAALAGLPSRFLFALDDGAGTLGSIVADVELVAEVGAFRLVLDGHATSLLVSPAGAPEAALGAARAFLALAAEEARGVWRVRELTDGAGRLARRLGLVLRERSGKARRPGNGEDQRVLGVTAQRDGRVAVAVLAPLARLGREQLHGLAGLGRSLGCEVRVSPWRTLTFVDVAPSAADGLMDDLKDIGLVVCGASGWVALSACAGLGACARARVDVRAAAVRRAAVRDEKSPVEHWSGCERRCGEPPGAGIRVVAREHGVAVTHVGVGESVVASPAAAHDLLERRTGVVGMRGYARDGAEIYRRSFATIRAEAELDGLDPILERVVVRMIHACGMVDLVCDVAASPAFGASAEAALRGGAPILCDTAMVAAGITRSRLPAGNEVLCTLNDLTVPELAKRMATTRTAAAVELWRERLDGALVVVGNAPTALFRLLEIVDEAATRPAAVIGVPVGFIGAAESKAALAGYPAGLEHLVVHGRRGGSAIAVAAVNALASEVE